jgi:hypothetical protein
LNLRDHIKSSNEGTLKMDKYSLKVIYGAPK